MTALTVTMQADGLVILDGDLTFATINKKTVKLIDFKAVGQEVIIDFSKINQSDSAGLALIIEWLKNAKTAQKICKLHHLPTQLLTLAQLSGFDMALYFPAHA